MLHGILFFVFLFVLFLNVDSTIDPEIEVDDTPKPVEQQSDDGKLEFLLHGSDCYFFYSGYAKSHQQTSFC